MKLEIYKLQNFPVPPYVFIGELNSEKRIRDDKEKYYILWKEIGVVDQLNEYNSNNTLTDSVVIGMVHTATYV